MRPLLLLSLNLQVKGTGNNYSPISPDTVLEMPIIEVHKEKRSYIIDVKTVILSINIKLSKFKN